MEAALAELMRRGRLGAPAVADLLGADRRLIVYGSLVPGGANHEQLAELSGTWHRGWVTGRLREAGWGAGLGYPALEWAPDGERVPAYMLVSGDLPRHWERLDSFEGDEYRRVLVPFFERESSWRIGQVYAHRA